MLKLNESGLASLKINFMVIQDIANRLVELCRKNEFEKALDELFSQDAVSLEPHSSPAFDKETKGLSAIKEKGVKWNNMVKEVHEISVSDPLVSTNSFACNMRLNVTMKEHGAMDMSELCVYQVKDGKIILEQFFP
ncbi:MAG: SnoaL-like domain-containing protein [Ginsengibacter sp.]